MQEEDPEGYAAMIAKREAEAERERERKARREANAARKKAKARAARTCPPPQPHPPRSAARCPCARRRPRLLRPWTVLDPSRRRPTPGAAAARAPNSLPRSEFNSRGCLRPSCRGTAADARACGGGRCARASRRGCASGGRTRSTARRATTRPPPRHERSSLRHSARWQAAPGGLGGPPAASLSLSSRSLARSLGSCGPPDARHDMPRQKEHPWPDALLLLLPCARPQAMKAKWQDGAFRSRTMVNGSHTPERRAKIAEAVRRKWATDKDYRNRTVTAIRASRNVTVQRREQDPEAYEAPRHRKRAPARPAATRGGLRPRGGRGLYLRHGLRLCRPGLRSRWRRRGLDLGGAALALALAVAAAPCRPSRPHSRRPGRRPPWTRPRRDR